MVNLSKKVSCLFGQEKLLLFFKENPNIWFNSSELISTLGNSIMVSMSRILKDKKKLQLYSNLQTRMAKVNYNKFEYSWNAMR